MYKWIFVQIVFYLDMNNRVNNGKAFLDLKIPLIYNVSVYVPMEFRGRRKNFIYIYYICGIKVRRITEAEASVSGRE